MKMIRAGLIAGLAVGIAIPAAAQEVKAITGATVIGGAGAPIPDAVVIIEGTRIARVGPRATTTVPANATIIDARGKFVIPGLADMHNHLEDGSFSFQQNVKANLPVLLAYGVTTVLDPSVSLRDFADVKAIASVDSAPAPRFFGTGPMITVKGDTLGAAGGGPTPETAADARTAVSRLKQSGVDAIKVSRDDLGWASSRRVQLMALDVLAALIDEAHRQGLKVYAHAPLLDPAKEFLRAGGDGLMHGIIDKPIDQELIDLMLRNRAVYVPTLAMFEDVGDVKAWTARQATHAEGSPLAPLADSLKAPDFARLFTSFLDNTEFTRTHLATLRANVKRVFDAGIPVVMGTDSGFFGVVMGASSQMELAMMVEAGLTPENTLRAATINAARMIGREKEAGSIESGKLADLLILDANPLEDIRNVRRVFRVVKAGTVFDPAQLLASFHFTAPAGRGN